MMQFLKNIILIALLLACPVANAQEGPALLRKITVADGLPQGYISAIVQDSKGFIWIGTRNGLTRYDGRKFRTFYYVPSAKGGLSSGIITNLWLDKKDNLWITYESGHLDIFNTGTEKIIPLTAKKKFAGLKGLLKRGQSFVDEGGKYWLLSNTGQVYVIDGALTSLQQLPQKDTVTGIASTGKSMVLATRNELLFLNHKTAVTEKVALPHNSDKLHPIPFALRYNSLLVRKNGEIAIIGSSTIITYQPATKKLQNISIPLHKLPYFSVPPRVLDDEGTIYFQVDGKGKLWRGTESKIFDYDLGLFGSPLLIDRSGVAWSGTGGLGIEQFDLRITHLQGQQMKTGFHSDILKKAGVNDKRAEQLIDTVSGYSWRWLHTKSGALWVAQSQPDSHIGSVFYLDNNKKVNYPQWRFQGGNPKQVPTCAIAEDVLGRIWGIGFDMRLYTLDPDTKTITFRHQVPFDMGNPFHDEINGLVTQDNDFWISTTLGLLHYNTGNGKTARYFPDVRILSIIKDPVQKDILWLGTMYAGLIKFNTKTRKYKGYTTANGMPGNAITNLLSDDNGNLWGITDKGIISFALNNNRIRLHNAWGERGQLEFNRHHYFRFSDGRLAFGGAYGYVIFNPQLILSDNYKPETLITSILINNRELAANNEFSGNGINGIRVMELPYDKNSLTFEFAATEYNLPEKIQYRYRMKGLDEDWVLSGSNNTATYSYIPPGEYELHINASNTIGEWSDKVKVIKIKVAPPFWRTWWFISNIVLIVVLLIYFGISRKITQTRKKDLLQLAYEREALQLEAKAMRLQMNPHFIFNCLNSIKSLIHDFRTKEAILYLTTFAQLLRNQLNSNLLEVSLANELDTCRLYLKLEALRFGEKLQYEFDIHANVDTHAIKIPALLLQPFVENAIIHGLLPLPDGGKIKVSVVLEDETIYCKIDDNGAGRDVQVKKPGHESKGVKLVEGRLGLYNAMHNSTAGIEIIDKKDSNGLPTGTLVVITLNV